MSTYASGRARRSNTHLPEPESREIAGTTTYVGMVQTVSGLPTAEITIHGVGWHGKLYAQSATITRWANESRGHGDTERFGVVL